MVPILLVCCVDSLRWIVLAAAVDRTASATYAANSVAASRDVVRRKRALAHAAARGQEGPTHGVAFFVRKTPTIILLSIALRVVCLPKGVCA